MLAVRWRADGSRAILGGSQSRCTWTLLAPQSSTKIRCEASQGSLRPIVRSCIGDIFFENFGRFGNGRIWRILEVSTPLKERTRFPPKRSLPPHPLGHKRVARQSSDQFFVVEAFHISSIYFLLALQTKMRVQVLQR